MRRLFPQSLRTKTIVWFLIPTVAMLIAVAILAFRASQQVTKALVLGRNQDRTELLANQLSQEIKDYAERLNAFASTSDLYTQSSAALQATWEAANMKHYLMTLLIVCLAVTACHSAQQPKLSPHQVVHAFYRWYVGYPGNPLVDKEYRSSPHLTAGLIEEIDRTLASFDKSAYDPILMAQNIPERFEVTQGETSGNRSKVTVRLFWGPQSSFTDLEIDLVQVAKK